MYILINTDYILEMKRGKTSFKRSELRTKKIGQPINLG